ncbi:ABC transporter ATP-binding protein [Nocardia altamirensis]|uniref:ABC transporter ATP-binding protein n=1 Tax=Nocardia altamirensis TaxID=472158 RepID=UPI00083FE7AA|nr:ATP-binding cassette domain-containing protein [Nocardia altamirensis]
MIRIENLSKSFGRRALWSGLNMTIGDGQLAVVAGPSGSGKTTLLNCLGLLDRPVEGRVLHDRTDMTALSRRGGRRYRRDNIGYLFQHYALIEDATIADNLRLALTTRGNHSTRYHEVLDRVGLAGRDKDNVYQLSGGEQQRVALAQLLLKNPPIVLADEPTASLDNANADTVIDILRELAVAGATVIVATHNDAIRAHADIEHELTPVQSGSGQEQRIR